MIDTPSEATPRKRAKLSKAERAAAKEARATGSPGGQGGHGGSPQATQAPRTDAHPRKKGPLFITTREGTEVCFTFAKGARDACPEPCQGNRTHVCQLCLGPHRNSECGRANNSGKAGKGGKGK